MRRAGSLLMQIAAQTAVPAGHALAVDREKFAEAVTEAIEREPLIRVVREEVTRIRRERRHHHRRQRAADVGRALAGDPAAQRQRSALLLRLDQPDRGGRFHRHVAGVHGRALRQGHGRLHQLPDDQRGVRPVYRCAAGGAVGGCEGVGEAELLRGLPADRGDCAARARHAALRADEAGGAARSEDRARLRMRWCSCGRRTCAPIPTTWSAFRTI